MFALTISRTSMKMGYVESKNRSNLRITVQKAQLSDSRAIMALLFLLVDLQCNTFENTHNEQVLLFTQCFLPISRTFRHNHQIWNCGLQTLSVWQSLIFVSWERFKCLIYVFKCPGCFRYSHALGKESLTLSQTTNFKLSQTERVCRQ